MSSKPFTLHKENIYILPATHYNMEMAAETIKAFHEVKPDCIAVELPESMQLQWLHAASRLPDISVVVKNSRYFLAEPCDASFEALRLAQEHKIPAFCIDLEMDDYPDVEEPVPDTYSLHRLGLKAYYEIYKQVKKETLPEDEIREFYMAKRLKELSFSYDRILFITGMAHAENIFNHISLNAFPQFPAPPPSHVEIATLTEESMRQVMSECGYVTCRYEESRYGHSPDRQKLIYRLCKESSVLYKKSTGNEFPHYNLSNTFKFGRNYALITGRLLPDLYQLLTAAKGSVDHNYAYETWKLATEYPHLKNIDNLEALNLKPEDIWRSSKHLRFHLKQQNPKSFGFKTRAKDKSKIKFQPPGPFSICSYPPEDIAVENFGDFLKKKGTQILSEEASRTIPFSTSIEDGVDTRETIRHWAEKKLYVKTKGKPPGGVGSVVVIFDEDKENKEDNFPWHTTWLGEHSQESDMSFYATPLTQNVVGPGISRCEYGGFMMSYPPRRLFDVWQDPDYEGLRSKAEVLLAAAIDYAVKPLIVYAAKKPPRSILKSYAKRFGKKIIYIPLGQLSPVTLNKLRVFHVLDGHDRRGIAGEYIF